MLQNFQRGVACGLDLDRGWRKALWGRESYLLGFLDSEESSACKRFIWD